MTVSSYGRREVAVFGTVFGAATVLLLVVFPPAAVVPALGLFFTIFFFRDPRRAVPEGEGLLVAPADGRVVAVERTGEPEFLRCEALVVRIFLSVFDVHINRAPGAGRVEMTKYRPGRFLNALRKSAALANESNLIGFSAAGPGSRPVAGRQISGTIARRIVCAVKEGDHVDRGEKIGMIKFGSMTELYVPADAPFSVRVAVGDRVRAGTTVIGRFEE